jgi:hypothetical protein
MGSYVTHEKNQDGSLLDLIGRLFGQRSLDLNLSKKDVDSLIAMEKHEKWYK